MLGRRRTKPRPQPMTFPLRSSHAFPRPIRQGLLQPLRQPAETLGLPDRKRYPWGVEFEWDPQKAASNLRKHKVSFPEAATVLGDPLAVTAPDPDHSAEEDRSITVGRSVRGRLLLVAHAERGERIRIISARELTRHEREAYEEA